MTYGAARDSYRDHRDGGEQHQRRERRVSGEQLGSHRARQPVDDDGQDPGTETTRGAWSVLGQGESLIGIVLPTSAGWWVLIGLFGTAGQPGLGPSAHSTRLCRRQARWLVSFAWRSAGLVLGC